MNNISRKIFTWIPLYQEIADKLVVYRDRQSELIQLLEDIRAKGFKVTPLNDRNEAGGDTFLVKEIDPFTFMGTFNRGIRIEHRIGILTEIKKFFQCKSELPVDFDGIPVLNNQKSWLVAYQYLRRAGDVEKLWNVFTFAQTDDPHNNEQFRTAYDEAIQVRGVNVNLSMGLFWIRPETFLNMDGTNRKFLDIDPKCHRSSSAYKQTIENVRKQHKETFPEISLSAYRSRANRDVIDPGEINKEASYWFVGAYITNDLSQQFIEDGVWEHGFEDERHLGQIREMQIGEKIAIKAWSVQKNNLPFEYQGQTASKITIKARGIILAVRDNGRTIEVEWDPDFEPRDWYFFTNAVAIWKLQLGVDYQNREYAERLIRFVFFDEPQDYQWFLENGYARNREPEGVRDSVHPFGIDDMIAAGVFLDRDELEQILDRLRDKKNLILQGAPGVGKTFVAEKLAFALMQETDRSRIKFVQFHQSYSYEDFVRGYRPLEKKAGVFGIQDGIFFDFCEQARADERVHVLIIDEINRGNLSQIFGELLMLIEKDKRKEKYAVPLMYPRAGEPDFFVPENLYIIGMMNLADRSLALVDYALRRRFAFKTLVPKYQSDAFSNWLVGKAMPSELIDLIVNRMSELNQSIADDESLGENYMIGHSYFCPNDPDLSSKDRGWYDGIIETEIIPLLKEYWFDDKDQQKSARERLLAP